MEEAPFRDIRVVELAQWVFVPVAGALLADWGADVIRVEPLSGDPYRALQSQGIGADADGVNLSVALAYRGKRSVALDIKTEAGMALLHRLLESADVFLTNFRPGALGRLGLGAAQLTERYPKLVYARGHGYGVRGPDADRAGYDSSAYWSRGGVGHVLTPPDRDLPLSQRGALGDRSGAMALAFAMSAALLKAERTGKGSVVDVSLLATAMWTISSDVLAAIGGDRPRAQEGRVASPNPVIGAYRTKDDRHIQLNFLQPDRYWPDFCRLIGRDELIDDPRFVDMAARRQNREQCVGLLEEEFASRSFAEWKELLNELDAPWAPVQAVEELLDDPQVVANGYIGEVSLDDGRTYRLPAVPVQFDEQGPPLRPAPESGEHTEEVLLELGYDWEEIVRFKEAGAVA